MHSKNETKVTASSSSQINASSQGKKILKEQSNEVCGMFRAQNKGLDKLKEIFTDEEIKMYFGDILKKQQQEEDVDKKSVRKSLAMKNKKINHLLFDRNNIIQELLKIVEGKLRSYKENSLANGLKWISDEIKNTLILKAEDELLENIITLKEGTQDMQNIYSWFEEYSNIKQLNEEKKILKSVNKSPRKTSANIVFGGGNNNSLVNSDEYFSNKVFVDNKLELIDFGEDSLTQIEDRNFDIFSLESVVGKENILTVIGTYVFMEQGLYSCVNYQNYENFLMEIARGYVRDNPYHTDLHAADVAQTCYVFIKYGNIKEIMNLSDIDTSALIISALIHDFKHPGLTNSYLVNSKNVLALTYNDQSVLENFHVAEAFKIIHGSDNMNIFVDLNKEEYKLMRKRIVDCVLATDMTLHTKEYTYLKMKLENYKSEHNQKNFENMFKKIEGPELFSTQQEFMNCLIHTSDISNPTKPLSIYLQWTSKVMEEFWRQGDKEKTYHLPISFLCDRETVNVPKSQIGFMEGICSPLISTVVEIFPDLQFLIDNLNKNKEYFKKIRDEEEEKKIPK